jgi:hypothetical protein
VIMHGPMYIKKNTVFLIVYSCLSNLCTDVINIEYISDKRDVLLSNQITCLLIINRSEMAHPQKDDHANVPFQDPGRLFGSVLRE